MFVLHNESPEYIWYFPRAGQLCPFCRGTHRQAHRSALDLLLSSCLQHTTGEALCQELFLYLGFAAVPIIPSLEPGIFALSSVAQGLDAICVGGAAVITDS